jgi:hypothetical protein
MCQNPKITIDGNVANRHICATSRGSNSFRRNDAIRAIKSARDAGVNVSGVDVVVAPDGTTTFRVYGDKAASEAKEVMSAREWEEAIDREKTAAKAKK